jgi:hypothetical protein
VKRVLLFSWIRPRCSALRSCIFNKMNNGAHTTGTMMAKMPKPQRQLSTVSKKDSAAFEPANAVIMYGEEVKANARPRFLKDVTSAARTATV